MRSFTISRIALILATGAVLISLSLSGCGGDKKIEPVAVGALSDYKDPGYGFSMKFPDGWKADTQVGRAHFYSAEGVDMKFRDPLGSYPNGVVFAVDVTKSSAPADDQKKAIEDLKASGVQVEPEQVVTIGDKQGVKVAYTARYSKQSIVTGYHIYVPADTLLYDIDVAGFGDTYVAHKAVFDTVMGSFHFPKPVEPGRDQTLPSDTYADNDAKLFSFQYPDNFNFVSVPKGNNELALGLRGVRQDCSILFHVFDAKALTLEKVFDQNKGKYAGASTGKATIGGQPALTLTYAPTRDVERKFVFVVKDGKVYRVTLDWFKPQRAEYAAAYDKVLSSIKFK